MAWIRACGGGSTRTSFNFNPLNFASGAPSPTTNTAVPRTFTKGTYFNGLTNENAYWPNNISSVSFTANSLSFYPAYTPYGPNFVLNNVQSGKSYKFKVSNIVNISICLYCYKSDGTYLGVTDVDVDNSYASFTVPSDAEYVVLTFRSVSAYTTASCSFN